MSVNVNAAGWTLVHFLWQGALIALVLEAALSALRERSAELRYTVRCGALLAMALAPVATYLVLSAAPRHEIAPEVLLAAALAGIEPARGILWTDVVVALWALGASFFAARLLRDWLRVRRLHDSRAGALLPLEWQVRFDTLGAVLGVRGIARVVDSAALSAPTVIGWMKPVVLIPARVLTGLSTGQVEALLAHELAHVRRHDYLVNLVQSTVEALLFYHPAVWWVSNGIRAEREYCCDDVALRVTRDRLSYARALTTLEGWRGAELEIAMSTLGGPLMQRIQRLVGIRPPQRPSSLIQRGPLAAFTALLVLGYATSAFGKDPAPPQDAEEIRALQAEIEAMEARLAEMKAELARTRDDPHGNVWVEDADAEGKGNIVVRRKGDGVYEVKGSGVVELEGDDGETRIVVEVRGTDVPRDVHEHVREALKSHGVTINGGDRHGDAEAEAEIHVEVLGGDGETLHRRLRIGGLPGGSGGTVRARRPGDEGHVVIDLGGLGGLLELRELEDLHESHGRQLELEHGDNNVFWFDDEDGTVGVRSHGGGSSHDVKGLRDRLHAARRDAEHTRTRIHGDDRIIRLRLEGLEGLEQLHELKGLEHLRHLEGLEELEGLHERIREALEKANIRLLRKDGEHGDVRVLRLDDLDGLKGLHADHGIHGDIELELDDDLLDRVRKARIELGDVHGKHGNVRILRLDDLHGVRGEVELDDDLLEKVRKARIEIQHGRDGKEGHDHGHGHGHESKKTLRAVGDEIV